MKKLLKSRVLSSVLSIVMLLTLVNGVPAIASKVDGGDTQVSLASQLIAEGGGIPTEVKPDLEGVVEEVTPKQEVSKPPVPKPEAPRVLASTESTWGTIELTGATEMKSADTMKFYISANYDVPDGNQKLMFKFMMNKETNSGSIVSFNDNAGLNDVKQWEEGGTKILQGYIDATIPGEFRDKALTIGNISGANGDTINLTMEVWRDKDPSNKITKTATVNITTENTEYDLYRFNEGLDSELYKTDGWYNAKLNKYYFTEDDAKTEAASDADVVKGRFYSFVSILSHYQALYYRIIKKGLEKLDLQKGISWDLEYSFNEAGSIQSEAAKKPVFIGARFVQERNKNPKGFGEKLINFQNFPMEYISKDSSQNNNTKNLFNDAYENGFILYDESMVTITPKELGDGTSVLTYSIKGSGEKAIKHNVYGIGFTSLFFLPEPADDDTNRTLKFELKNLSYQTYNNATPKTDRSEVRVTRDSETSFIVKNGVAINGNVIDEKVERKDSTILTNASVGQSIASVGPPVKAAGREALASVSYSFASEVRRNASKIDVNQLVKFDADYFKPKKTEFTQGTNTPIYGDSIQTINKEYTGTYNLLYATKKDGSNWTDRSEMFGAKSGELVYYSDVTEAQKSGRKVVAYLFEYRNGKPSLNTIKNTLNLTNDINGDFDNRRDTNPGKAGKGLMVVNTEAWINTDVPSYKPANATEGKDASTITNMPATSANLTKIPDGSDFTERTDWDDNVVVEDMDMKWDSVYNGNRGNRLSSFTNYLEYKFNEWEVILNPTRIVNGLGTGRDKVFNIKDGERGVIIANDIEGKWVGEGTEPSEKPTINVMAYRKSLNYFTKDGINQTLYQDFRKNGQLSKKEKLYLVPRDLEVELVQVDEDFSLKAKDSSQQSVIYEVPQGEVKVPLTMGKKYTFYQVQNIGNSDPALDLEPAIYQVVTFLYFENLTEATSRNINGTKRIGYLDQFNQSINRIRVTREGKGGFSGFKGASKVKPKDDTNPVNFRYFAENPEKDNSDFFFFTVLPFNGEKRKDASKPVSSNIPETSGEVAYELLGNKVTLKQAYGRPLPTLDLYYTLDKGVRTKGAGETIPDASDVDKTHPENSFGVNWTKAPEAVDGTNEKVYTLNLSEGQVPTAFILKGNFKKDTNFEFNFSLSQNQANKANDEAALYVNEASAYFGQDAHSNAILLHSQKSRMTQTKVVTKTIKGTIERKNGTDYVPANGLMVELKDAASGTTLNDVYGNALRTQTDSSGAYVFKDMVDNQNGYKVVVVSGLREKEYVKDKAGSPVTTGSLNPFTRLVASISNTFRVLASGNQSENTPILMMPTFDALVNEAGDKASEVITKNLEIATLAKSITGAVFADANGDGNNTGENVPSGTKVELFKNDSTNTPIGSAVTSFGSNGSFTFSDIPEGELAGDNSTYKLRFTFPEGYNKANQFYTGNAVTTPTKVNANSVFEKVVTLKSFEKLQALSKGTDTADVKLGVATVTKTIRGKVTKDGKVPSSPVTVTLQNASGTPVATTSTDNSGAFTFENPADHASYKVSVPAPVKGEFIIHALDTTTSHQTNTTDAFAMGTYRDLLTANTLTKTQNVNFLYTTTSKTIKGKVTLPGVTNYSAYTVKLYEKKNDGSFTAITQSVADDAFMTNLKANGTYKFVNPADSETKTYKVEIGGFTKGSNQFGELTKEIEGVDNYSDIFTAHYTNPSNSLKKDFTLDFAVTERSKTIKGTVKKVNGSPVANMDITLLEVTSAGEKAIETDLANVAYEMAGKGKTDASGKFEFKNPKDAENGRYIVRIGSVLNPNQKMEVKVDSNWSKADEKAVSLGNYAALSSDVTETVEFRMTELSKSITGQVKFGGQGTDKFNVELYTKAGVKVAGPIHTDSNGNYTFSNITKDASDYVVKLVKKGTEPTFTNDHIKKTTVDGKDTFSNLGTAVSDKDLEIPVKSETFDQMWAGTETAKSQSAVIDFVKVTSSVSGKILDANDNGKDGVTVEIYRGRKTGDPEKIATVLTKNGGIFSFDVQDKETENGDYIIKVVGPKPVKGEYIVASYGNSEEATNELTIQADTRLEAAKAGDSSVSLAGIGFKYAKVTKVIKGSVVDEDANISHVGKSVNLFVGTEKIATTTVQAGNTYSFDLDLVAADKNAGNITYKIVVDTTLAKNAFVRIAEGTGEYGDASKTLEKTVSMRSYKALQTAKANEEKTVNFKFGKIKKSIKVLVRKDGGDGTFANGVALERAHFTLSLQDSAGGGFTTASGSEVQPTENQEGTEFEFDLPTDTNDKNYYVTLSLTDKNNEVYLFLDPSETRVGAAKKTKDVSLDNFENLIADAKKADRTKTISFFLKSMKKNENPSKSITVKAYVDEDKSGSFTDGDKPYVGGTLSLTDGANQAVAPQDTTKNYDNAVTSNDGTYTFLDPKDEAAYKVGFALKSGDEPYYTFVEEDTNNITLKSYYDLKYDQDGNGTENKTKVFRLKRYSKTIKGKLWDDKNKDGNVDDGENPFANVELILTDKQSNPITHDYLGNPYIFKTNEKGEYEFTNLPEKDGYIFKIKLEPNNFSHIEYQVNGTYDEKTGEVTLPTYDEVKQGKEAELTVNVGLIKRIIYPYFPTDDGNGNGGGNNGNGGSGNDNGGNGNGGNGNNNGNGNDGQGGENGGDIIGSENPPVIPPVVKGEDDFFIPPFVITNDEPTTNEPEVTDIDVEDVPLGNTDLNLDVLEDGLPQGAGNIKADNGKGGKDADSKLNHAIGGKADKSVDTSTTTTGKKVVKKILAVTGGLKTNFVFAGVALLVLMLGFVLVEMTRKRRANKR